MIESSTLQLKYGVGTRMLLPPPREGKLLIAGLDLGQAVDPAALIGLEACTYSENFCGPRWDRLIARAMRRWPLGTDYCQVADDALDLGADILVVDYTGVGRGVVDYMRRRISREGITIVMRPVTIVASNARARGRLSVRGETDYLVPKCDLVGAINVLKRQQRLLFPRSPEYIQLRRELSDFKLFVTRHMRMKFDSRGSGHHGDLVMALGLASWWVTRFGVAKPAMHV